MDLFNYKRRLSSVVQIGNTPLGGSYPIRIQSMASVSTMDTVAAVNQAMRMTGAGAEYLRFTAQGEREARNLGNIRRALHAKGYTRPLVADIHFHPAAADVAAMFVEKVRINPGNYADRAHGSIEKRFVPFLKRCRENSTAIRIGVNHGSLSERIMSRYGDTPEGMVESCMEFLRLCAEEDFDNVVLSVKASNTVVMIRTVRLLVRTMDAEGMRYPLHLGVTEAGDGEDGRIKSAVGIGALLADGIGDTIRVSLSEDPEMELPVARKLSDYFASLENHAPVRGIASPLYDPLCPSKRQSRMVGGTGGNRPPAVLASCGDGSNALVEILPDGTAALRRYPCFSVREKDAWLKSGAAVRFISLTYGDLDEQMIRCLKTERNTVAVLGSTHRNGIGEMRAFMHRLLAEGCDVPVILRRDYDEADRESLLVKAAADFGALLTDGFGDGVMMCNSRPCCDAETMNGYLFGILQAARVRISRPEYISCPGCGRTLFNLQKTVAQVKSATAHLTGLKIGVMGCIVNGPGEMADADYGYVGAGRGRINLYKGKVCVLKNIPEEAAVSQLLKLISAREQ